MSLQGKGTVVSYNATGSGAYTNVAGVIEASFPEPNFPEIDDTDLDSVAKESFPGTPDNGKVSIKIKHSTANFALLATLTAANLAGTVYYWKVTLSDTKLYSFRGYLNNWKAMWKQNDLGGYDVSLTVTGAISQT